MDTEKQGNLIFSVGGKEFKMGFTEVKASSEAPKVFETGAQRIREEGKGRFDLVPSYPMQRLAVHFENGAKRRGDRNWEKGLPLHTLADSAERHLNLFKDGNREEDHLAAVLWNIVGYIWTEREIREGRLPDTLYTVPWGDSTGQALPEPIREYEGLKNGPREYTRCHNCGGALSYEEPKPMCHCSGAV